MDVLNPSESWEFEDLEPGIEEYTSDDTFGSENRIVWDDYEVDSYMGWEIVYQQRWKNGGPYVSVLGVKNSEEFYPQSKDNYDVKDDEKVLEVIPIPEEYSSEIETFIGSKDVKGEVEIVGSI